jgi:hypothetical protein
MWGINSSVREVSRCSAIAPLMTFALFTTLLVACSFESSQPWLFDIFILFVFFLWAVLSALLLQQFFLQQFF